jgi:hypothetical protein
MRGLQDTSAQWSEFKGLFDNNPSGVVSKFPSRYKEVSYTSYVWA